MLILVFAMGMLFTSCYKYTTEVGKGAQGTEEVKQWNHYLIFGLVPVGVSDPQVLAGSTEDYDVEVKHSFINGLLQGVTFGIYTPTTTTVRR